MCVQMQLQSVLELFSSFYNIIFKIKHKLYITSRSALFPPLPFTCSDVLGSITQYCSNFISVLRDVSSWIWCRVVWLQKVCRNTISPAKSDCLIVGNPVLCSGAPGFRSRRGSLLSLMRVSMTFSVSPNCESKVKQSMYRPRQALRVPGG